MKRQTEMGIRILKAIIVICLMMISALLGSNSRQAQNVITPYLSQEENVFSVLILAEENDYIKQTYELNGIVGEHLAYLTKAGVLSKDSKEGKKVRKELGIRRFPAYILLDHKKAILIQDDVQKFKSESRERMIQR
ncbi:hypothetical protein [Paenibacillus bouchesdurhonensis]|uniref:hypothetical protein n=1 Tax=Paenibacillus bouchesdurhonensis TaxID=1870990 RepID=UPI000DA6267D|nr:hypothetical protein [Paenibacillus bouchesdurhonensis]